MAADTSARPTSRPTRARAAGSIGVDEWVAPVEGRRERQPASPVVARAWDALPPVGRLLCSLLAAVAIFPFVTNEGNLFRYGSDHADLRAAGARAEHRRRLRRAARPRLRRLLRVRRVRLRDPRVGSLRPPLAGRDRDSGRDRRRRRCSASSRPAVAPAGRRLPRDRHALLRSGVRRSSSTTRTGSTPHWSYPFGHKST